MHIYLIGIPNWFEKPNVTIFNNYKTNFYAVYINLLSIYFLTTTFQTS